jgi:hypothetical protein
MPFIFRGCEERRLAVAEETGDNCFSITIVRWFGVAGPPRIGKPAKVARLHLLFDCCDELPVRETRDFHPAVMIKTLELNGLIERTPGQARNIRLLVLPEHLTALR